MSRWKGMDEDISDDQQDIARGRGMVDSKFQGGFGLGGTAVRYSRTTLTREPDCERIAHPSVVRAKPRDEILRNGPGTVVRCDRRDRPRVDAFLAIKHACGGTRRDTQKSSHTVAHATSR